MTFVELCNKLVSCKILLLQITADASKLSNSFQLDITIYQFTIRGSYCFVQNCLVLEIKKYCSFYKNALLLKTRVYIMYNYVKRHRRSSSCNKVYNVFIQFLPLKAWKSVVYFSSVFQHGSKAYEVVPFLIIFPVRNPKYRSVNVLETLRHYIL